MMVQNLYQACFPTRWPRTTRPIRVSNRINDGGWQIASCGLHLADAKSRRPSAHCPVPTITRSRLWEALTSTNVKLVQRSIKSQDSLPQDSHGLPYFRAFKSIHDIRLSPYYFPSSHISPRTNYSLVQTTSSTWRAHGPSEQQVTRTDAHLNMEAMEANRSCRRFSSSGVCLEPRLRRSLR